MSYEPPNYGSPPPPPPGGGGGYGAPPPPGGGGYGGFPQPGFGGPQPQQTSVLAIISLVAGILSIVLACCCSILGLAGAAGVICGFLAKKEIRESGGAKKGDGLALAGMITGGVGIVLGIALFILTFVVGAWDYSYYS